MKNFFPVIFLILILGCKGEDRLKSENNGTDTTGTSGISLDEIIATEKVEMNLEEANKLGQTLGSETDLQSPQSLHPAFYGCFDWHSSVHAHWSLVRLLKKFPKLDRADEIKEILETSLSKENINKELEYFRVDHNRDYE